MKRAAVIGLALLLAGCTLGYRHTRHTGSIKRNIGELDIGGSGNTADLSATFDFRYFRLLIPFEAGRRMLEFTADDGGRDTIDLVRERRYYRLDVPVVSLWDFKNEGFGGYPGLLRHRHTFDVWVSGETNLHVDHEWWIDLGLAYYRYNGIGVRLFFGAGAVPFDAATPRPGTRFPAIWHGDAPTIGGGLTVTITAGEFALDLFQYLAGVDRTHRNRANRQNPGF